MKKNNRQAVRTSLSTTTISRKRQYYYRYRKAVVVSLMTMGVMGSFFVQLVLANSLATRGSEIKELEEKRSSLIHEMSILNEQAAELSSVARISREAKEKLGLDYNSSQFEYLQEPSLAFSE